MRSRRLLLVLIALLGVAFATSGVAFVWLASLGRPLREGEVRLPGASPAVLSAPVLVRWDGWGVPQVTAQSVTDLVAAQGWLHANDRLTQMELGRRAAAGRLSEIFGGRALALDHRFRTLRFHATAQRLWERASPESQALLQAYAAGVNAWLRQRGSDLPPDLTILGVEPEPWRPVDSLGFVLLMANDLSFWQGRPEETRYRWLRAFGPERMRDLVGDPTLPIPEEIAALAAGRDPLPRLDAPAGGESSAGEGTVGSNNWALGGSRTVSGRPLVANDPHLPLRLPGVWYQVLLRAPDYEVAGMSLPGVPGVVLGRNRHVAWAFTNTMLDDHDLFFERLDASGTQVLRSGGWAPITETVERIRVQGGGEVELRLRATDRGPLLEADAELGLPARSLAWALYEDSDPMAAFLALGRARRVEEIPSAIGAYAGPAQNLVAADEEGGLLFTVLGRVPERRAGEGRMPSPAWVADYGWWGLRPQETNPTVIAPADDLLVTANTDILPEGYPLPFSADFDTPYRAERIRELLMARHRWAGADLAAVQTDVTDLMAHRLLELLGREPWEGGAREALDLLSGWDGTMKGPMAAFYALVTRELGQAVFGDEAEQHGLPSPASRERLRRILAGEMDPAWFDDVTTPEIEDRHQILNRALAHVLDQARLQWGHDPSRWSWEAIHPLRLSHPLGQIPLLGRWFDRGPFPMPGSPTTVDAFGGPWGDGEARIAYGPSMRWVADLADPDRGLAVLPGGQSGHPGDPHYDDQIPLYLKGELRPVAWSEEAIEKATVTRLTLLP